MLYGGAMGHTSRGGGGICATQGTVLVSVYENLRPCTT